MIRVRRLRDVRTRLLLIVLAAILIALVVATIGFNIILARATSSNANSLLQQRVASEREFISVVDGKLRLAEPADDPAGGSRVWVFSNTQPIEQPRARAKTEAVVVSMLSGPRRYASVPTTDERLYAVPIVSNGKRLGTIVAGLSLAPYEQTRHAALTASLAFAATLLLIAGGAAAWTLRSALRPVAVMTELADAWSEQDLDRRFARGEPHDELSRLAFTLDRLLDRIAASLRHERRFSAELSHELRTPLAKLTAEAELALRRPRTSDEYRRALMDIHHNADQLARIVETLFAAARQEAGPRGVADAADVAHGAVEACALLADEREIALSIDDPGEELRVGVDLDLAERILNPVVENACKYGRRQVSVSLARSNGSVEFTVSDDGPGVTTDEREAIFEPATRGEAGRLSGVGAGLGLALARRLARSVEGDVEAAPGGSGTFVVRLPAA